MAVVVGTTLGVAVAVGREVGVDDGSGIKGPSLNLSAKAEFSPAKISTFMGTAAPLQACAGGTELGENSRPTN